MSTQLKRTQLGTALLDWAGQGTPEKHFRKQDDPIKGSALTYAEAANLSHLLSYPSVVISG